MRRPRGKSVAVALALGTAAFLGIAAYAARHRILEAWHLHRLESGDPAARLVAIGALGRFGSARAVPALCRLLDSPSREERTAATVALGAIGPDAEEAVKPLVRLFHGEPVDRFTFRTEPEDALTELARTARSALARIGPAAIPAILEASLETPQPQVLRLLVAFDEGLLPLVDAARLGATRIRTSSCMGDPRYRGVRAVHTTAPATALECLVRHTAGAPWEDPAEVSRLAPLLNQWRAGDDSSDLLDGLPLGLLSSDDDLARTLAADLDVGIAREIRSTCVWGLSNLGAGAASALPFLLDCFDDEARLLASDVLGRVGAAAVGPLLSRMLHGTKSASFHAEFALIDAGMIDLDAARSIVRALPAADGETWTRLTRLLDRIGKNAVIALEEASEGADAGLRRAARTALLSIQGRDRRGP